MVGIGVGNYFLIFSFYVVEIEDKLVEVFHVKDPLVKEKYHYKFRCPFTNCSYFSRDLKRHLVLKHEWEETKAKLEVGCRLKLYRYLTMDSHKGIYKPRVSTSN